MCIHPGQFCLSVLQPRTSVPDARLQVPVEPEKQQRERLTEPDLNVTSHNLRYRDRKNWAGDFCYLLLGNSDTHLKLRLAGRPAVFYLNWGFQEGFRLASGSGAASMSAVSAPESRSRTQRWPQELSIDEPRNQTPPWRALAEPVTGTYWSGH